MPAIPAPALLPDARPVRVTGPRIARLVARSATATEAQRATLVADFWNEVERLGAPLIEELVGEPEYRAVTFLWRGHRATRQVLLFACGIADHERLAESLLEQVPGTDVWHLGLRLRTDHRGSYRMAADISSKAPPTDPDGLQKLLRSLVAHTAPDPLNPRRIPDRWRSEPSSVFALPHAPDQRWAGRAGSVPAGRVERHRVPTAALGGDRDTWVYLPPGHADDGDETPLPVLVLMDGDMWFGRLGLGGTLDALMADGALPPLAVLAPDAVDRHVRHRELGANGAFLTFLADEMLPWATARRPLTTDPRRTVVAGQGLGATTALYAAYARPERFGNVLAQSASLWWRPGLRPGPGPAPLVLGTPWLVNRFRSAGPLPVTFHLDVGLHEGSAIEHHRALYDALRATGNQVTRTEFNGGHDYACWHPALAEGLVRLLGTTDH
ncbi:enterochelin esterase [Streptomyces sp. NPDC057257]|uniref:enterochelin esterase n=1 Tax=Streptomyces sp. NPDC057257 TaxID=3346071 RepID=UPI00364404ED